MKTLEELMKLTAFYDSCTVQGHSPIKMWVSTGTKEGAPEGAPITCARCGCYLSEG